MHKKEEFIYFKCLICKNYLGFEVNDNTYNYGNKSIYLIKANVKVRENKKLNVNLISFKDSLLSLFKEELTNIYVKLPVMLNINKNIIYKSTMDNFKDYKKNQFDVTFIIHKLEGRVFLMGRNGYFNNIISTLKNKLNSNIYIILLSKETKEENCKILDELITRGGEEDLRKYRENNRILFINDFEVSESIKQNKLWFEDKIKKIDPYII